MGDGDQGGALPHGDEDDGHSDAFSSDEKLAIEVHKWYLSEKAQRDVGWDFAVADWKINHQKAWREHRRKKHEQDLARQQKKIDDYKWLESEKAGKDLGHKAEQHWVDEYADIWRVKANEGREAEECTEHVHREHDPVEYPAGTRFRRVLVINDLGLHVRPSMALKRLIAEHMGHQVYAENLSREDSSVVLIREMCDILELIATCGDRLEFGVVGPNADKLLDAIAALFASRFGERT